MVSSWTDYSSGCKSRWPALARSLYFSRLRWHVKCQEARRAQKESQEALAKCEARCRQLEQENDVLRQQVCGLQADLAETPDTPQHVSWDFLWDFIQQADVFIAHPIPEFVPQRVPQEKVIAMPPTIDALDGLNKPLSPSQKEYYLYLFNKILLEHHQQPLDLKRPFITQIARFDPSKGIMDVIEAYHLLRQQMQNLPVDQIQIGRAHV